MIHIIANPADILLYFTIFKIEIRVYCFNLLGSLCNIIILWNIFAHRKIRKNVAENTPIHSSAEKRELGGQQRPWRFIVN